MSDLKLINSTNVSGNWSTLLSSPEDEEVDSLETFILVLKCIVMVAIMVGAVFGNLLVITSVIKFERLRTSTNFFIVSLAFADLLVAMLVMPFSASVEISGKWVFGRTMCDIFNANDVLFSTASILHLCCISMDRYIAIIHPLQYEIKMTRNRVAAMLATTWVASCLISYIPVHSQLYTTAENYYKLEHDHEACTFIVNKIYAGVSSCVSFWIPCFIMVFVYAKIFLEARKQEKFIQSTAMYMQYSDARGCHTNGTLHGMADTVPRLERKRMKREHKAAKTLGVIMGAFILCFLPFFSWYVITTMCDISCPTPPIIVPMLFWIGYFNSCLNPILYAYFNRDFRTAFKKLLKIDSMIPCDNRSDPTTQALNTAYADLHKNSNADMRMSTSSAGRIS